MCGCECARVCVHACSYVCVYVCVLGKDVEGGVNPTINSLVFKPILFTFVHFPQ